MTKPPTTVLALLLLAVATSIAGQPAADQGAAVDGIPLIPIPYPDLEALEPAVADQLATTQTTLKSIIEDPEADKASLWEVYGELGQAYQAYGLDEAAFACYRNAYRLKADDFRWPYLLGVLSQSAGSLQDADRYYWAALPIRPAYVPLRIRISEVYLAQNRLDLARFQIQEALVHDPQSQAARAVLAEIALAQGRHQEAIELVEQLLKEVPQANRYHHVLGMAYRGLGEMEKAKDHLARRGMVGIQQPDPLLDSLADLKRGERVYLLRGRMAFNAGRYAEAAAAFATAVAAKPDSVRARINWASSLALAGDRPAAIAQFREALKLEPESPTAHFNLGSLLARQGEDTAATEHLQAAVAANPSDGQAHLELARVLRRNRRLEDAQVHYLRAAELDPRSEDAALGVAGVLVDRQLYQEARELLEESLKQFPGRGLSSHALARLLAACPRLEVRDGERAYELASLVYNAQPIVPYAETVAMALAELDRCDEAAEWLRRALAAVDAPGAAPWPPEAVAGIEATLARYEQQRPCRLPGE
ncbi:MAG: tetratricopeptide repeat protein [Thermoanaerobaculia bacterium]